MYLWILLCVVLLTGCLCLTIYILALKREIRKIKEELTLTRQTSYNRQITVSLFDKDLSLMTVELNKNLDYQKQLKMETAQTKRQMKQSVSDIAHDLRTPLSVIKGNLQMLQKEKAVPPKGKEYLRICFDKVNVLKTMIDDFFELSVLESDHILVELKPVDITNMLMQFVVDHEAVIREYGLTPDIQFPDKSVFVLADEQMLLRMFGNLLNNIVKYAHESFLVKLECVEVEEVCRIRFSNAVDKDQSLNVEHLFERSYRGDSARQGSGAGLGLYIVKLLADKQGAEVKAKWEKNQLMIDIIFKLP